MHHRFFPGPQGSGANVIVPMTDFSLPEVDGDRLTHQALAAIIERTGETRSNLRKHGFAEGNKVASEMGIRLDKVNREVIPIELFGGPTLRDDFSYKFKLPQTPATLRNVPQTIEALFEIYANKMMGGNASNVFRNSVMLAQANLGAARYEIFSPQDRYLDEWLTDKLQANIGDRFQRHELKGIDPRIGIALPYDNGGQIQQFSFNRPQGSTIGPMTTQVNNLRNIDHVVVSEGLGVLLAQQKVNIAQIFNPTSALHIESALEFHRRKEESGNWQDIPIINDDEMGAWLKTMEIKQYDIPADQVQGIEDAKFPMPFLKSDPTMIDGNSVLLLRKSHQRLMNLGHTKETDHVSLVAGVGCGPKGGQNQFQCRGLHYVAAASTLSDDGAANLINLCGLPQDRSVQPSIRDVVGAGDAAFTATLMHRLYAPLEDIIEAKHPQLSDERKRIAAMAFTTILQRVFGELVYHSKVRDLSGVPSQAFPIIFDKTLDKAIAAALKLTTIDKVPSNVYRDEEWGLSFMAMELER